MALAVLLGGIMAWAGANGRLTSAPEQILSAVLSPFQKGASAVSGGVGGLLDKYARIDSIIAENEALKEENWELHTTGSRPRTTPTGSGTGWRTTAPNTPMFPPL